jgi:hypothetical protein
MQECRGFKFASGPYSLGAAAGGGPGMKGRRGAGSMSTASRLDVRQN